MKLLFAFAAGALIVAVAGALPWTSPVSLSTIVAEPSHYEGKHVRVVAEVAHNVGFLGTGAFLITDGAATVAVVTMSGVPAQGETVEVEGTFHVALSFGATEYPVIFEQEDTR